MEPVGYLPLGMIAGLIGIILLRLWSKKRNGADYILWFLLITYVTVVLMQAFFSREPGSRTAPVDFILFDTWGDTPRQHAFLIENILMFIPFGILLSCINPHMHIWQCILSGALFSFFIETMQLITGRGFCQLDDLVMNTAGTAVGCLLVFSFRAAFHHKNY